jgi:hypothetical protein
MSASLGRCDPREESCWVVLTVDRYRYRRTHATCTSTYDISFPTLREESRTASRMVFSEMGRMTDFAGLLRRRAPRLFVRLGCSRGRTCNRASSSRRVRASPMRLPQPPPRSGSQAKAPMGGRPVRAQSDLAAICGMATPHLAERLQRQTCGEPRRSHRPAPRRGPARRTAGSVG